MYFKCSVIEHRKLNYYMKFSEFNLEEPLLEAISYMGFDTATPIQEKAIPLILENSDLIACAQTGTGKTVAFVLPILNKLSGQNNNTTNTLIIVPTRELAVQIEQQIQGLSYFIPVGSIAVYGGGDGKDWVIEQDALQNGTDIIVATPGRLLSHLQSGNAKFDNLKHLVLDEADRMFDMGFIDDIQKIIMHLPKDRQTLMFSATMPNNIRQLAKKILHNPLEISLAISKPAEGIDHKAYVCYDEQKVALLTQLIVERKHFDSIIIFTSTKSMVNEIVRSLNRAKLAAKGISSNLDQASRESVLRGFMAKQIRILVATDVMSRGIDVKEINLVVNFDVPHDAEDYVHRVGRTARVNAKGEALTLVNPKDMHKFRRIEQLIEYAIPKLELPADIGPGPIWEDRKPKSTSKRNYYKKKKSYRGKN